MSESALRQSRYRLDEGRYRSKSVWLDRVQGPGTLAPRLHQACPAEHGKMLRRGLLGDVDLGGDLADRARAGAQQAHDRDAPRLTEGLERPGCLLL